jgi:hypothetical protein
VRKALEVPLAYLMSALWPKARMMEVYLNVAQFGPGIFGVEAASRYYFRKSAADLSRHEAILLVAALPNPRFRNRQNRAGACFWWQRPSNADCRSWHRAPVASCRRIDRRFFLAGPGKARRLPL